MVVESVAALCLPSGRPLTIPPVVSCSYTSPRLPRVNFTSLQPRKLLENVSAARLLPRGSLTRVPEKEEETIERNSLETVSPKEQEEENEGEKEGFKGHLEISRRTLLFLAAMATVATIEPSLVLADMAVTVTGEALGAAGVEGEEELRLPGKLKNRYWVLRHGRSRANESNLIVSDLANGRLPEYGLSSLGLQQAAIAGEKFSKALEENNIPLSNVRVFASPFSRTQQTAQAVVSALHWELNDYRFQTAEGLRERYYGPSMELGSHDQYTNVWMADLCDPTVPPSEGGESVTDVAKRVASVVRQVEAQYDNCTILFVSHGDTLQILQATLLGAGVLEYVAKESTPSLFALNPNGEKDMSTVLSKHRGFALQTGELRPLQLL